MSFHFKALPSSATVFALVEDMTTVVTTPIFELFYRPRTLKYNTKAVLLKDTCEVS